MAKPERRVVFVSSEFINFMYGGYYKMLTLSCGHRVQASDVAIYARIGNSHDLAWWFCDQCAEVDDAVVMDDALDAFHRASFGTE